MCNLVCSQSCILDPNFDMFTRQASELPEFKEWREELLKRKQKSHDGSVEYEVTKEVLRMARTPAEGSGEAQATETTLAIVK